MGDGELTDSKEGAGPLEGVGGGHYAVGPDPNKEDAVMSREKDGRAESKPTFGLQQILEDAVRWLGPACKVRTKRGLTFIVTLRPLGEVFIDKEGMTLKIMAGPGYKNENEYWRYEAEVSLEDRDFKKKLKKALERALILSR